MVVWPYVTEKAHVRAKLDIARLLFSVVAYSSADGNVAYVTEKAHVRAKLDIARLLFKETRSRCYGFFV